MQLVEPFAVKEMKLTPVSEILTPAGFGVPALNALIADVNNYTVLLMQPQGNIEASAAGVWNRDRGLAGRQFGKFLEDARETQADLVITPEYSMPWDVLVDAVNAGICPGPGKLWVLGCESIKYSQLESIKERLGPSVSVLCEELAPDSQRFVDPLAYLFLAPPLKGDSAPQLVILVQFKTYPMGDKQHFEINGLQCGTRAYEFGGSNQNAIRLVSLICSDAFAFKDTEAEAVYDRTLVVHIQLNPAPRHDVYRGYRDRLFDFSDDVTELICLNWAAHVHEWSGGQPKCWDNIAASAWYLKPDKFDKEDNTLSANHRRGLYYTWLQPLRVHALFFNFAPATYFLTATKVVHIGVKGTHSHRRGPQLTAMRMWDEATAAWKEMETAEDGFSDVVSESGGAKIVLEDAAKANPFAAERILALCSGQIVIGSDWHDVRRLDSCVIDKTEVIRRVTFCQDTDTRACDFRVARLKRCGHLWNILKDKAKLPPALKDFEAGFRLEWSSQFPHQNAISDQGKRATLIYMGEDASRERIEQADMKASENIYKWSPDEDESDAARQRVAVWFRDQNGVITILPRDRTVRIDQARNESEVDIGGER